MSLSSKLVSMEVINSINYKSNYVYSSRGFNNNSYICWTLTHTTILRWQKRISKWAYLTVTHLSIRLSASFKGASEISLYIKSKRDEQCTRWSHQITKCKSNALLRQLIRLKQKVDLNNIFPAGGGTQLVRMVTGNYTPDSRSDKPPVDLNEIPLDWHYCWIHWRQVKYTSNLLREDMSNIVSFNVGNVPLSNNVTHV